MRFDPDETLTLEESRQVKIRGSPDGAAAFFGTGLRHDHDSAR